MALSESAKNLLISLKESADGGAFATACDGTDRAAAQELNKAGYAEWKGTSWGSSFWAITDEGVKRCNRDQGQGQESS